MDQACKKQKETKRAQMREEKKGIILVLSACLQADGEPKIEEQGFHTFFLGWDKIPF